MPRKTLTLVGIVLILSELGGFPHQWKTVYGVLAGIFIVILAFRKSAQVTGADANEKSSFKGAMTEAGASDYGDEERGQTGQK